jgi:hypothetical protein
MGRKVNLLTGRGEDVRKQRGKELIRREGLSTQ